MSEPNKYYKEQKHSVDLRIIENRICFADNDMENISCTHNFPCCRRSTLIPLKIS